MSATIKFNIIKVVQPIGIIYLAKIQPKDLLAMSVVDRRRIENDEQVLGVQRELNSDKIKQIRSYLTSNDATFPNSIIVNVNTQSIINENDNILELLINEDTFTIIDGQHRVEGFRDNEIDHFELILAIFKDLKIDQQANIFSTINSEQTKVDPSLNLNLELNNKVYTPKKMMIEIAQSMNYDKESPWFNNIKMLGAKTDGIISLSAFVKPLLLLTYPEKDYYLIRNELINNSDVFPTFGNFNYKSDRYIFWQFYRKKDFNSVYKILFNYFQALKVILSDDWLNYQSLLNKTTGYNAIMILFKDIFIEGYNNGDLSYDFFFEVLKPLNILSGKLNSTNYGTSGFQASNELYAEMKAILDKD